MDPLTFFKSSSNVKVLVGFALDMLLLTFVWELSKV